MSIDPLADALARRLMEALPAGRPHGREALGRLPAPVAHLLAAALDRRVARDAAPPASDWVDAENPALADAARQWREAARDAAQYPAAAWAPALTDACRLAIRHLIDPGEGASAFCFAGERGEIPTATALARLSAFGPYAYLREIVEEYVTRKGLATLDRAGLEGLMRRIDRRMAEGYGAAEWAALLAPLYALAEFVPERAGRIHSVLLRRFFVARGAEPLADALSAQAELTAAEVNAIVAQTLARTPAVPPLRDVLMDPRDAVAATRTPGAPAPPVPPAPPAPLVAPPAPPVSVVAPLVAPSRGGPPPIPPPIPPALEPATPEPPTAVPEPVALDPNATIELPRMLVPEPAAPPAAPAPFDMDDEDDGWEAVEDEALPDEGDSDDREGTEPDAPKSNDTLADEELADDLDDEPEDEGWETVPDETTPDAEDETPGTSALDGDRPDADLDDAFGLGDEFDAPLETEPIEDDLDLESTDDEVLDDAVAHVEGEDDDVPEEPTGPDADEPEDAELDAEPDTDEPDDDVDDDTLDAEVYTDAPDDPDTDSPVEPEDDADDWPAAAPLPDTSDTIDLSTFLKNLPPPPAPDTDPEPPEPDAPEEEEPTAAVPPVRRPGPPVLPPSPLGDLPPVPAASTSVEPLWQRLAREHAEMTGEPPASEGPTAEPEPVPEVEETPEAEPSWQRFTRDPSAGLESLAQLEARVLGPGALERRDWYVTYVADGSESSYRSLLDALDDAESWADAWPVLAAAFKRNRVDLYADAVVSFTDAAQSRYE